MNFPHSLTAVLFGLLAVVSAQAGPNDSLYRDPDRKRAVTNPMVVACWRDIPPDEMNPTEAFHKRITTIPLGEVLVVRVQNLGGWLDSLGSLDDIALVLNHVCLKSVRAFGINRHRGELRFELLPHESSEESIATWSKVIGGPRKNDRMVTVTVAEASTGRTIESIIDGRRYLDDNVITRASRGKTGYILNLEIIRRSTQWWALGALVLLFVVLWYVIRHTTILRMSLPMSATGEAKRTAPYSLATFQLFFWWAVVLVSIIFLWLVTGVYMPIPETVMGILGVSTITNFTAKAVDDRTKRVAAEKNDGSLTKLESLHSINFVKDIINDGSGTASLTRLQNVSWTILFGCYYMWLVYSNVSMPDIDSSMLILMGLASSAYVGAKYTEPIPTKTGKPEANGAKEAAEAAEEK